jgi:hypothetical protein
LQDEKNSYNLNIQQRDNEKNKLLAQLNSIAKEKEKLKNKHFTYVKTFKNKK